ncbi:MAG: STAS domain-containing protein, partial [Acidimicrobiia bacterium]|nr:STAS domain-containing protein [Acidimicrobiia bacterium]
MSAVRVRVGELVADGISIVAFAVSALGMAISVAAFVFSESLEAELPRAVGAFVMGGAIVMLVVCWRSQFVPVVGFIQDAPAVVLATIAASLVSTGSRLSDIFVFLALATLLSGIVMLLIGLFEYGNLVRYVPSTVVGAFIAGTGWLLFKGGIDVASGMHTGLSDIPDLLGADLMARWVPAVALGFTFWFIAQSPKFPPFAVSLVMLAAVAVFFLIVYATSSVAKIEAAGWLIGPFADGAGIRTVSASEVANADWRGMVGAFPGLLGAVAVAVMASLLNTSGLQFVRGGQVDINAELRTSGLANITIAPLGSAPGFLGLGDSILLERMGVTKRAVGIGIGVVMGFFAFTGTGVVGYMPRAVSGGLLITIGVGLLADWTQELRQSISRVEQLLSIGILAVIAFVGILEGIAVGIVAVSAVFVVRYSRIDPVRTTGSGSMMRSRVDRSPVQTARLAEVSDRAHFYQLNGYLFFGSLALFEDRLRDHLKNSQVRSEAILLDTTRVTGIDTSGFRLLGQLATIIDEADAVLVITGMDRHLQDSLTASQPAMERVTWFSQLDDGFEFIERLQLDRWESPETSAQPGLDLSSELRDLFESISLPAGTTLMIAGS